MEVGVMPRENIRNPRAEATDEVVDLIAVGWRNEGDVGSVQLGVVETARVNISVGGKPLDDKGLFMDLDRQQINRLIRNLQRARDQAYGADA